MSLQRCVIPTYGILEPSDIQRAEHLFEIEYFKSGDVLLEPQEISQKLYFIYKGLVTCVTANNDILWFESEKHIFTDPVSFLRREPSENYLRVLDSDTVLVSITFDKFNKLVTQFHQWALWANRMTQDLYVRLFLYYKKLRIKDANKRYQTLIDYVPNLLQRVSLKDIASCIGISPVSLSRIRGAYRQHHMQN